MADHSSIEWTDATWNPITGCSVVSPGCTNCYAMKLAGGRLRHHPTRQGLTVPSKAGPVWNGQVRLNEGMLTDPLRWTRPRRIFPCAHGDLFHESVPDAWIDQVFAVMAMAKQHTYQVLTKRAARMRAYLSDPAMVRRVIHEAFRIDCERGAWMSADHEIAGEPVFPLPNVWLGVSAEDQARADERIPPLLTTPAAVRFLSAEPLLGPLDLTAIRRFPECDKEFMDALGGSVWTDQIGLPNPDPKWARPGIPFNSGGGLDWVIVGGESGPGARPMHPDWARQIRDDCADAGVPFFFKQWGNWREAEHADLYDTCRGRAAKPPALIVNPDNGTVHCFVPDEAKGRLRVMVEVGKKAAGRVLDEVTHDAMPEVA